MLRLPPDINSKISGWKRSTGSNMTDKALVRLEKDNDIGVIVVDNPPVNALSPGVPEGIIAALNAGNADPAIRAMVLIGAGLSWMTPFTPVQAGGMALVIVIMGFFGGLVMCAIKRDRGVKDWGHLIAGHGGFIDRLDSVIFSAPVFFHLTRYFWSMT